MAPDEPTGPTPDTSANKPPHQHGGGGPGVSRYSILQHTAFSKMFENCKEMGKWPICRRKIRGNKTLFEGAQPLD